MIVTTNETELFVHVHSVLLQQWYSLQETTALIVRK